jgi:hypothetical protein
MLYSVQYGDSPSIIARRFGVAMGSLLGANPHKPTTLIAGVRTWQSLRPGETVSVPVGGMVGDALSDALSALATAGSPCDPANAALVCALQRALGVPADGKWGSGTAAIAQKRIAGAPGGCSPRPSWWAPAGQTNCLAVAPVPGPRPQAPPQPAGGGPPAVQALTSLDPCDPANVAAVCAAQRALGIAADGKYGADTSTAARRLVAGAPAGCSPRPSWWAPTGRSNCPGAVQAPVPAPAPALVPAAIPGAAAPAALQALTSLDPCDPANVAAVCAAQRAMGVAPDGKWGTDSGTAARARGASLPGCSPRPSWWAPAGRSNCPGAAAAAPAPIPPPGPPAIPIPPPGAAPTAPAALQAIATLDPCDPANVAAVCAAQHALGIAADGKWGTASAAGARAHGVPAPAGCSPRPSWWTPAGQSNCGGAAPPPVPTVAPIIPIPQIPQPPTGVVTPLPTTPVVVTCPPGQALDPSSGQCMTPSAPAPVPGAAPGPTPSSGGAPTPTGPAQPIVTTPEKGGISTGAIVAGALGAVALVGVIAVAASGGGKKPAARRPAHHPGARKPAKHKKSKPKKRR